MPHKPRHLSHVTFASTLDSDGQIDSEELLLCKGLACNKKVSSLHCITLILYLTYSSIICRVEACLNSPKVIGSVVESATRMQLALNHIESVTLKVLCRCHSFSKVSQSWWLRNIHIIYICIYIQKLATEPMRLHFLSNSSYSDGNLLPFIATGRWVFRWPWWILETCFLFSSCFPLQASWSLGVWQFLFPQKPLAVLQLWLNEGWRGQCSFVSLTPSSPFRTTLNTVRTSSSKWCHGHILSE